MRELSFFYFMNFFVISALVNLVTSSVVGFLILAHEPGKKRAVLFSLFSFSVSLWSLAYYFWQTASDAAHALIWAKTLMAFAAFIPIFYFHFTTAFLTIEQKYRFQIIVGYIFATIFFIFSFTNHDVITGVSRKLIFEYWPDTGYLYLPLLLIWITYAAYASYLQFKYYRTAQGELKSQLFFISWGTFIGYVGAATNYFLWFDIPILPIGNISASIYVVLVAIAVVKHGLFNVKVITTEFFVLVLCIVFLTNIFTSETTAKQIVNISILLATLSFGMLLVRSVKKEIKQREEIDKLAQRLSSTNWELSRSNERLRVMDQRKSEFVSIASHQLRTPVTAIKGYSSLLLEDSYGKVPDIQREPIQKIFLSSQRLVEIINDFLNVSKIEQGTMTYAFAPIDLRKMATDIVQDFHVAAGEKQIDLAADFPQNDTFIVNADEGKIRQIISNLIDNAIKYTPKGNVRLILEKEPHKGEHGFIILKIKDTGVGLSQDDLHHLFGKFARGTDGQKLNTSGSGLGLYVAKKMLEEHKGNIWVDSEGQGKGSVFCIELPEYHGELPK